MDRNSTIGLVLIAGILIVWSILVKPSEEEKLAEQRRRDSLQQVQIEQQQKINQSQYDNESGEKVNAGSTDIDSDDIKNAISNYGAFANNVIGEKSLFTVENNLVKIKFSNKGGRPYSVELKDYKTHDQKPLLLFDGDSTIFGFDFFSQNKRIQTNQLYFKLLDNTVADATEKTQVISYKLGIDEERYILFNYTLAPDSYMVDFDVQLIGMNELMGQLSNIVDLKWEFYMPQQEKGRKNETQYSTLYYKHHQDDVEFFRAMGGKSKSNSEDIPTALDWVAFKSQFFSSILLADDQFENGIVEVETLAEGKYIKKFNAQLGIELDNLPQENIGLRFYFGPNKFKLLKKYEGLELQSLVTVGKGAIRWINQFVIIPIFDFLSRFIANYGIIIALLTLIIKLALFPLTYKSYVSQARMRVLKPQIDAINEKIPADKAMERQQATMALYKKVGISPMGGCLPMLLQMPILFAMFRFFPTSIELRQQSFLWAHDLSTYDAIIEWSGNIPIITKMLGNHISLFTVLMTATTILQMKTSGQAATTSAMPGMKGMMYVMPVMFLFVLNNFSSGLTYYYFLANVITLAQNLIFKQMIDEKEILKKLEARKAKPKKKSNFQQRMEQMAKQKGYQTPKRK